MEVWKIVFLSKWMISRFHANLPGCIQSCWLRPFAHHDSHSPDELYPLRTLEILEIPMQVVTSTIFHTKNSSEPLKDDDQHTPPKKW